ncbi:hypothetical protein A4A49_63923, partial [Nicotiana attenuata]
MSISFEALAMAGADYLKDGMSFEEFEQHEAEVPHYLLADEEEDDEVFFLRKKNLPTKSSYEYSFCSQEFHICENDEGEQK